MKRNTLYHLFSSLIVLFFLLIALGSGENPPKPLDVLPKTLGSWHFEKSKNMGGMNASINYELLISKEGIEYIYNCKMTFIDEYSGNVPQVEEFNGKLGEIFKTGEWEGKPEWGIKLIGGQFGDDNCFIGLGVAGKIEEILYVTYPKGTGDQLKFERN